MKEENEITIHRPTGPRLTFADPVSKGELVAYRAGRATGKLIRSAANAVAACKEVIPRPSLKQVAFHAVLAVALFVVGDPVTPIKHLTLVMFPGFHSLPFSRDANGWSVLTPTPTTSGSCGSASPTSDGSCIWYVSNAGTDDNTNCIGYAPPVTSTPATTCATAAFALGKMRSGKPDWVLFKRGETFTNTTTNVLGIRFGDTKTAPAVLSAYPQEPSTDDDRPIIDVCGTGGAGPTFLQQQAGTLQGAITSLILYNSCWDPASGANYWSNVGSAYFLKFFPSRVNFLLVEDVKFDHVVPLQFDSLLAGSDIYIRRNVFYADTFAPPGVILGAAFKSITIEENLFYKGYLTTQMAASPVTITAASPAVVTYTFGQTVAPENGGLPAKGSSGNPPQVWFSGTVPTGMNAATQACTTANNCYYLRNISGNTANISATPAGALIDTTGSDCTSGCASHWVDGAALPTNHNIYLGNGWDNAGGEASGPNIVFQNNITAYASATGSQIRAGGRYYNNLYLKNPIQLTGVGWPSRIAYNVMLEATDMQSNYKVAPKYGWGMDIADYTCAAPAAGVCTQQLIDKPLNGGAPGTRVDHNIIAQSESTGVNGLPFRLNGSSFQVDAIGHTTAVSGVIVDHNIICDWPAGGSTPSGQPYNDRGSGNTIDNTNLPDPTTSNSDATCSSLGIDSPLTAGNYYDTIGGPGGSSTDDFLEAAKSHWTKFSWDPRFLASAVNDYIRPSYGMANP